MRPRIDTGNGRNTNPCKVGNTCVSPPSRGLKVINGLSIVLMDFACNGSDNKASLICMKWAESFSSFVNKSDMLFFPAICWTLMKPSWTASRIAFSRI